MAPEQYAATAIDHRADVFAAGVVFYQLLTGEALRRQPGAGRVRDLPHRSAARIARRREPGKGWERYDALVAKALAKRPEDRFQTADAFRAALLEAHARPAAASISDETIITEILRPGPRWPAVPSGRAPQRAAVLKPPAQGMGRRAGIAGWR